VPKPFYQPRILQSLKMLFLYQFIFFPILFVLFTILLYGGKDSSEDLILQIFSSLSAFLILLWWLGRKYKLDLTGYLTWKGFKVKYFLPMISLVLGVDILISETGNIIQKYVPIDLQLEKMLQGFFSLETGVIKSFLLVVLLAPVLEEVIFRGLLLRGFLVHYSRQMAILVSSFLFGVFHLNLWQFPGTFLWGIIAGWWFIQTDSLFICVFGHFVLNGTGFAAALLKNRYQIIIPGFSSGYGEVVSQPFWLTVTGFFLFLIGFFVLREMFRKERYF